MARMRYVVTGGAGFIGSNTVDELVRRGESVVVMDDLSAGKEDNLAEVRNKISFIKGSINDLEAVRRAMHEADCVLHLAARTSVPRSIKDPLETNRINIEGTLNVLVAARDAKVNVWCLRLLLPLTVKRPRCRKLKPCSRNRFPLTALPNTLANFTRRFLEKFTDCKTSACATSMFLARARILRRPIPACSRNSVLPSWKKPTRLFSAMASKRAISPTSTMWCKQICSPAKLQPPAEK